MRDPTTCSPIMGSLRFAFPDKDAANVDGHTPLHFGASKSNTEVVKVLLSAGADTTATTNDGKTPLMIAEAMEGPSGHTVALLKEAAHALVPIPVEEGKEEKEEDTQGRQGAEERKAQMEEQVARYERAVHSAWEDVQRAQQQAQQVEEHFERSRAHARQSAAEREEMETTLLDVAADLENLARNYRLHGSPAMAVPLYVSALAIFEKTLGAEHPQVASNLVNLGNAFCDQGKHAEAAPVYLRALAIDEKALGHDHPEVAMDLSNLGIAYRALGRADVAQSLFERAHKIMVSALGEGDPKTKAIYRNLMASAVAPGGDGAPAEPPPVVIEA